MVSEAVAIQTALVGALVAGIYIVLVRPQLNRIANHRAFVGSLKLGDQVVTGGGLIGTIVALDGGAICEIELSQAMRVRALKSTIESRFDQ